ncbi:MAG: hypothetical protein PHI06_08440 [Desulfobulbaceae bacterium]|nr:hypothetical protein [Desulfobulbaceae bacterium]
MKRFLLIAVITVVTVTTPALATDVGISVSIGQPGFYGQLDIGDFPRPQLISPLPIVIEQIREERPPIYLRVPPGHRKNWKKHCREYNACGEQVFFVQDDWYNREYIPRYQERHRDYQGDHRNEDKNDDHRGHNGDHKGKGNKHGH